jgi:hypothetical protein
LLLIVGLFRRILISLVVGGFGVRILRIVGVIGGCIVSRSVRGTLSCRNRPDRKSPYSSVTLASNT